MTTDAPTTPTPTTWVIDHELFNEPLEIEGLWSKNVMLMFAVRWLDLNLPHPDGDTWLIEKDSLTITKKETN